MRQAVCEFKIINNHLENYAVHLTLELVQISIGFCLNIEVYYSYLTTTKTHKTSIRKEDEFLVCYMPPEKLESKDVTIAVNKLKDPEITTILFLHILEGLSFPDVVELLYDDSGKDLMRNLGSIRDKVAFNHYWGLNAVPIIMDELRKFYSLLSSPTVRISGDYHGDPTTTVIGEIPTRSGRMEGPASIHLPRAYGKTEGLYTPTIKPITLSEEFLKGMPDLLKDVMDKEHARMANESTDMIDAMIMGMGDFGKYIKKKK